MCVDVCVCVYLPERDKFCGFRGHLIDTATGASLCVCVCVCVYVCVCKQVNGRERMCVCVCVCVYATYRVYLWSFLAGHDDEGAIGGVGGTLKGLNRELCV